MFTTAQDLTSKWQYLAANHVLTLTFEIHWVEAFEFGQGNPQGFLGIQDSDGQSCGVDIAVKTQPYLYICPDQQKLGRWCRWVEMSWSHWSHLSYESYVNHMPIMDHCDVIDHLIAFFFFHFSCVIFCHALSQSKGWILIGDNSLCGYLSCKQPDWRQFSVRKHVAIYVFGVCICIIILHVCISLYVQLYIYIYTVYYIIVYLYKYISHIIFIYGYAYRCRDVPFWELKAEAPMTSHDFQVVWRHFVRRAIPRRYPPAWCAFRILIRSRGRNSRHPASGLWLWTQVAVSWSHVWS